MGLPKDVVANMCFLPFRGDHSETDQVSKEGKVQFHMGGLSVKQTWLCSHCVLSNSCLYVQVGHVPPPWGQPLPLGHGPGVISSSKGMGARWVWMGTAIVNEVRRLAKVGEKRQAKAGLGSIPVDL